MTRFARRGQDNKKRYDGTDWATLKKEIDSTQSQKKNRHDKTINKSHGQHIKKQLFKGKKRITAEEKILANTLYKEQRREQRRQKRAQERLSKQVCFNCRLPGHKVSECMMLADDPTQGTGICFKCGSTEHSVAMCQVKLPPGSYPFAKCFVCGKSGHISKLCPDNPKGLYPKGGGCKMCGSVDHYKRDCPDFLKEQGIGSTTVEKISVNESVDAENDLREKNPAKAKKVKETKLVKF